MSEPERDKIQVAAAVIRVGSKVLGWGAVAGVVAVMGAAGWITYDEWDTKKDMPDRQVVVVRTEYEGGKYPYWEAYDRAGRMYKADDDVTVREGDICMTDGGLDELTECRPQVAAPDVTKQ